MTRTMTARAAPTPGEGKRLQTLVKELSRNVRAGPGNIRFEAFAEDGGASIPLRRAPSIELGYCSEF